MLSSTLWGAFATPVTYVLIVILLGTAVMQIRYVNKALQRFDSTQVIPIQFVMFTLCVIIGSAVLYRDFERTNAEQATKFVGGCLLTFFGVFLITSGREQSHDDDEVLSEDGDFEDTIGLANHDGNAASTIPEAPGFPTSKSRSRRSSHISSLNYSDAYRVSVAAATPQHDSNFLSAKVLSSQMSPGQETSASGFPWDDFGGPSTPPGRGVRTYSTDSVLAAPGATVSTAFASQPTTPLREPLASDGSLLPRALASPTRPAGSGTRSRTFISPSPLSSTVTAVVKDAFLRASDDPRVRQSSMRRIRSTIRAGLFFNEHDEDADVDNNNGRPNPLHTRSAVPISVENLPAALDEAEEPTDENDQTRRRSRSVSDTLGDFFGVKRKKRHNSYFASDVEDDTIGGATAGRDQIDRQRGYREV